MARDDDLLLAQLAAEEGVDVESSDVLPDHAPAKPRNPESGWRPRLNPGEQTEIFYDETSTNIVGVGSKGCRPLDTQIYTGNGLLRLGRLKPKDAQPDTFSPISQSVVSFNESEVIEAQATHYWNEGSRDAIRAELANGAELTGSPRHPVWVCWSDPDGGHGFSYYKLSEIEELRAAGWRFWTPFIGHPNWTRKEFVSVATDAGCAIVIDELTGYLLGALVGDGTLGQDRHYQSVKFSNTDPECIALVSSGLSAIGANIRHCKGPDYIVTPSKNIRPLLRALDLEHKSYSKRIPDAIIESPKSVAAAFLRGLFDTDGTVDRRGGIYLSTVSENLSRDTQSALAAFGILAVRRPFTTAAGSPAWKLCIFGEFAHLFGREIGFSISRKQAKICKPKPSIRCPHGFNGNRYGYPDPIRGVMRGICSEQKAEKSREWHMAHDHLKSFGSIPGKHKVDGFVRAFGGADRLRNFTLSDNWLEIVATKRAQCELGDLQIPGTQSFLAEGTINHNTAKTYGFLHRIVRHCYEENNALALIIGVSQRIASEGAGYDLTNAVLPTWRDGNRYPNFQTGADGRAIRDRRGKLIPHPKAGELMDEGIGLEFTEWKLDPVTKDRHLWIANRHGGWSKVLLVSIQHASEVKSKMYGIQPSLVYIEELMNCGGEEYYNFTKAQLNRRRGIQGPQVWMASQNPESPKHWTYKLLYQNCVVTSGGRAWSGDPEKPGIRRKESWGVYYVWYKDNEHNLPAGYLDTLMEAFGSDPILLDRMLNAKWIDYPDGDALFKNHYSQAKHLYGSPKKGTGLRPHADYPIVVGIDPGQVHTGISFTQCIPVGGSEMLWPAFDELCWFGERIPYLRATRWLLEKMRYWNELIGEPFEYRFISGDDAVTVFQPNRGSTVARDIEDYSRQIIAENPERFAGIQPIKIIGCPKPPGSKEQRVSLLMDLLDSDLLAVSAHCEWHDQMFLKLIRSKDSPTEPARGKYIHTFDSLSYPIYYQRYVLKGAFTSSKERQAAVSVSIR